MLLDDSECQAPNRIGEKSPRETKIICEKWVEMWRTPDQLCQVITDEHGPVPFSFHLVLSSKTLTTSSDKLDETYAAVLHALINE